MVERTKILSPLWLVAVALVVLTQCVIEQRRFDPELAAERQASEMDGSSEAADCADYCRTVGGACVGEMAVYESEAQCLQACEVLPLGLRGDTSVDTVGCRTFHAYSAQLAPADHCSHAGPGGDGHCGEDNCPAYCAMVAEACPEGFAAAFAASDPDMVCRGACASLAGSGKNSGYAVFPEPTGNDLRCRMLHASRAFADGAACAAALGELPCQ